MKDKVKKLTHNTVIYGLGNAMNKFMGIFLIPVYARFISIEQFGVLAIFEMSILFMSNIIHFGIINGHERYIIREKEIGEYPSFLFSNFISLLGITFVALFSLSLFSKEMSFIISGSSDYSYVMILVFVSVFFDVNNIMPIHKLQYENKPVAYVLQNLFKLVISLSVAIYLIIYRHYGIEGVFIGRVTGSSLLFTWQLFVNVIPSSRFYFNSKKVMLSVKYGFPVIFSSLGFLLSGMSDRYLVNMFLGNNAAGKYAFSYRMASMLLVIIQSIGVSYLPTLFMHENKKDNKRYYMKMLTYYTFIISWIIIGFVFFYKIPLWPLVKNKEYWDGLSIVPLLCFTFLFQGMGYFVNVGISLTNKNQYMILPSFIVAALNIGLNIWLLPVFGFAFAAFCALFSQMLIVSFYSFFSYRFYQINFEWSKVLLTIGVAAIVIFIGLMPAGKSNMGWLLVLRLVLLSLFPIVLYYLRFFEKIEIDTLKKNILDPILFKKK